MIVYHGSYCIVDKPDIRYSREALDFGKGFYLTNIKEQAKIGEYFYSLDHLITLHQRKY